MIRFLSITFCSSLAIFAGGLIAMMLDAITLVTPWVQIVIGVSAALAMGSLFCLEQTGALSK